MNWMMFSPWEAKHSDPLRKTIEEKKIQQGKSRREHFTGAEVEAALGAVLGPESSLAAQVFKELHRKHGNGHRGRA